MLHIYAALAEKECRLISERTKAGLAAAKRRGAKLGGRSAQSEKTKAEGLARAEALRPVLAELAYMSARAARVEQARDQNASTRPLACGDGPKGPRAIGARRRDVAWPSSSARPHVLATRRQMETNRTCWSLSCRASQRAAASLRRWPFSGAGADRGPALAVRCQFRCDTARPP
jgi:Resolvase, N terminal domain